jgi:nucleoside-diphosphate-sugar epimerase
VYGPGDDQKKFVPTVIRSLLSNQTVLQLTGGEQRRDFVYVDDVVSAFLTLLQHHSALPQPVAQAEVGSGVSESLQEVVRLLARLCRSKTHLDFGALPYRKGELMASQADNSLLAKLGWLPRVGLREGFERTIKGATSELNHGRS